MQKSTQVRALALVALLPMIAPLPVPAQSAAQLQAARQNVSAAMAAYRLQDWPKYEAELRTALRVQPRHPMWLYRLASAHALRADTAGAFALLDTLAQFGFAIDLARNDDFAQLRGLESFRARQLRLEANQAATAASETALQLNGPDVLPEGIAYDARDSTFFISSVHQRRILRVRHGVVSVLADSTAGLWGVFGLAFDPQARALWAVTAVIETMSGHVQGQQGTALLQLDAERGTVLRRIVPRGDGHTFNDVAFADGTVYISDGHGAVYTWTGRDGLRELVPHGIIYNPSGLAVLEDWLYVADYPVGLTRVSLRTKEVQRLPESAGISTYGIDGLYAYGRDLIAIQNALPPHRVVRITLSAGGDRVEALRVLEQAHPLFDEPTLGVVVGDALLYIANSRWARFHEGRYTGPPELSGPTILRLPLKGR